MTSWGIRADIIEETEEAVGHRNLGEKRAVYTTYRILNNY